MAGRFCDCDATSPDAPAAEISSIAALSIRFMVPLVKRRELKLVD